MHARCRLTEGVLETVKDEERVFACLCNRSDIPAPAAMVALTARERFADGSVKRVSMECVRVTVYVCQCTLPVDLVACLFWIRIRGNGGYRGFSVSVFWFFYWILSLQGNERRRNAEFS